MNPDTDAILKRLADDQVEYAWIAFHDYHGRSSAKTVPIDSVRSAVNDGVVFAKANLNMDSEDHQVAEATMLANSGDMLIVPDIRSYTLLPRFPGTALMHTWMRDKDGSHWAGCPRTRLDQIVADAAAKGYSFQAAFEPEFVLLRSDSGVSYRPVNNTMMYSQAGLAAANDFARDFIEELQGMGIKVPIFSKEYGPGQYEVSLQHGAPIQAVDRYLQFRAALHEIARNHGLIASLMPKTFEQWAGNSMHVHISIWTADGKTDLTAESTDNASLSQLGKWFVGGLLTHAAALSGICNPTVNSYKRLLPGSWAPANTYWGYGNRSGVIRVPGMDDRRHIEFRSPDNTAQPYLVMSALLAAGMDGIERQIDPGEPFEGDVGHLTPEEIATFGLGFLPRTLPEALDALVKDQVVCDAIGPEILKHFLAVKRSELDRYNTIVTDWERSTYLELH
jgi:glutamine synthetase